MPKPTILTTTPPPNKYRQFSIEQMQDIIMRRICEGPDCMKEIYRGALVEALERMDAGEI